MPLNNNLPMIFKFCTESNRIEGIYSRKSDNKMFESFGWFLEIQHLSNQDVVKFALDLSPKCVLRDRPGMNVLIGSHFPIGGGTGVKNAMDCMFSQDIKFMHAFEFHQLFEKLHPFMDGNRRTGRAIWLWMMLKRSSDVSLGFLHTWYYQSLNAGRR